MPARAARLCGDRPPSGQTCPPGQRAGVWGGRQSERVHLPGVHPEGTSIRQPPSRGCLDFGPRGAQGEPLKIGWGPSEAAFPEARPENGFNPSLRQNRTSLTVPEAGQNAALCRKHPWQAPVDYGTGPLQPRGTSQVLSKAVKSAAEGNGTLSRWAAGRECGSGRKWRRLRIAPTRFPSFPGPARFRAARRGPRAPTSRGNTAALVSSPRFSALAAAALLPSLLTFVSFLDIFASSHFLPTWRTEIPAPRRIPLRPDFPFGSL